MTTLHHGDVRDVLPTLDAESVQCVITSPPYWGLRDYGVDGQMGLEKTPEEYVETLVEVFREVRRVLRDDGTVWLNLGDSYANTGFRGSAETNGGFTGERMRKRAAGLSPNDSCQDSRPREIPPGLKPKDLVGIPWRVAFALQADGWYLRSDIIWHKPNPMPEGVTDRPTKSHEYLFLLTKSARYFYDADSIKEDAKYPNDKRRPLGSEGAWNIDGRRRGYNGGGVAYDHDTSKSNKRSVWTIATQPYKEAHFATFPMALVEPCIKAGTKKGDTVLDPFAGSGTVGCVALKLGRTFVGIELNPDYCTMARESIDGPLFALPLSPLSRVRRGAKNMTTLIATPNKPRKCAACGRRLDISSESAIMPVDAEALLLGWVCSTQCLETATQKGLNDKPQNKT